MEFRPVAQAEYDRVLDPEGAEHGAQGLRDAGAHPPALGRGALHRGDRSDQEGLRRGRSRHRARRRRTSSCSARSSSRTATSSAPTTSARCATGCRPTIRRGWCGARRTSTLRLLDERPLPGAAALGAARAGRDLRGAAEAGLQLPRPAGAVRHRPRSCTPPAPRCASSAAGARRPTATRTCRSWRRAWASFWRCAASPPTSA